MPQQPGAGPDPEPSRRARLHDHVEELTGLLENWLSEARQRATALRDIAAEVRNEPILSGLGGDAERRTLGKLEDLAGKLERATDQVSLLNSLLDAAAGAAPRVALFAIKGQRLTGWAGRGFAAGIKLRKISFSTEDDNLVSQAARLCAPAQETSETRAGNHALETQLGGPDADPMLAVPLWVRDRVVAVLYADAPRDAPVWVPEALQVMASLAALSLEALPARQKYPRPAGRGQQAQPTQPASAPRPSEPSAESGAIPSIAPLNETGAHPAIIVPVPPSESPAEGDLAALKAEAVRFARLLVSEILLYNGAQIEEGRRQKDLYQRLREDIERSREMYQQRVSPRLTGEPDIFRQELVNQLAQGDETALITPWG